MIHAFLWTRENNRDHSEHGSSFQATMDAINSSAVTDFQRPSAGYNITIYHDFHNEVDSYRVHQWICDSCGDWIKRAMNRKPSSSDCVEHKGKSKSCGNMLCRWHQHEISCSGNYVKIAEPPGYKNKKKSLKVAEKLGEDKPQSMSSIIKDDTQRLQKPDGKKERTGNKSANPITNLFPVTSDKKSTDSSSLFGDFSQIYVNHKELQPLKSEALYTTMTPTAPKRVRISQASKTNPPISVKRKRSDEGKKEFTVVSKWLDYYESEEMQEDIKSLINKRTERRKRLKMMKIQLERDSMGENMDEAFNGSWPPERELFHDASSAPTANTYRCPHIQREAIDCTSHAHAKSPSKCLPTKSEATSKNLCLSTTERTDETQSLNVHQITKQKPIQCPAKLVAAMVENDDHPSFLQACNYGCGTTNEVQVMEDIIDLSDD